MGQNAPIFCPRFFFKIAKVYAPPYHPSFYGGLVKIPFASGLFFAQKP